jgi:hypothetical protein
MIACLSFLAALAWYPCCCGGGGSVGVDCINCSGVTRDTVSVTISGAGNEDCDNCAPVIDGTIILPQTSNECVYSAWNSQDLGCSNANPTSYWQIKAQVNAGYWTVIITAYNSHGGSLWTNTVNYKWDSGGSSPIDCTLYRDLSLSSSGSAGLGPACDLDGLTMSLIPS